MTDNRSFEDRLLVALRKRGDMSMLQFLHDAEDLGRFKISEHPFTDEDFILGCEEYVKELEDDRKEKV